VGCGSPVGSQIFFISFVIFVNLVYLKLFIAIILQGFQDTTEKSSQFFNQEGTD